jgi:hypothetical protein
MIVLYNVHEYPKYLRISAGWHCVINNALDKYTKELEEGFVREYYRSLRFVKSYISASPLVFC